VNFGTPATTDNNSLNRTRRFTGARRLAQSLANIVLRENGGKMNELSGISAAAILFGFLSTGFWWSLNRELEFDPKQRHFKPGYALLILSIAFVGYFGLIVPLREASRLPSYDYLKTTYFGVTLGVVTVIGYMLTEFAHYSIFQRLKYSKPLEWVFFLVTILLLLVLGLQLFPGW
jgi:hypothetical protein